MLIWDRRLAVVAVATVLVAWLVGWFHYDANIGPYLCLALPDARQFDETQAGIFSGRSTTGDQEELIGFVSVGQADGYGGPMRVAVGVNQAGDVVGLAVVEHQETAAYYMRVGAAQVERVLVGKSYSDSFTVGHDVEAVTGATMTLAALTGAARAGAHNVAANQLNLPLPPSHTPSVEFGGPEFVLVALFGVALTNYAGWFRRKRLIRWLSLVIGLLLVGFAYNAPITLTNVNSLLLGFWPQWQTHIYWYLLLIGVLVIPIVSGRDLYCRSICPFGAVQECLGALGKSRSRIAPRYRRTLRWLPRILAWGAIILALTYRHPAQGNYEIYGALFHVIGTQFQFGLLALVLVLSLFVTRPWCNYLCPIRAVTDFVRVGRRSVAAFFVATTTLNPK